MNSLPSTPSQNAVSLRMGHLARLSLRETEILHDLPRTARHYPAQTELRVEGRVQAPLMLLSGWACYQRILRDGRRQIIHLIVPGDAIGSLAYPLMPATMAALALTPVVVTDATPLLRASDEVGLPFSGFAEALAATVRAEEDGLYNQVVRLGGQTAYERFVHLFLELHDRLQKVSLADGNGFSMPLTQHLLADALGLSVIHVNRTLRQVRQDRLLEMRRNWVTLLQLDGMRVLADWADPIGKSSAALSARHAGKANSALSEHPTT